jgi:MFS family permease
LQESANKTEPRDRWYVLAVLTVIYALNIADRFCISTLIEPIRAEMHLSDTWLAVVTGGGLGLVYVALGMPIAWWADRASRRNILALAIAVWSALTVVCGLVRSSTQLLAARLGVGLGEAGGTAPSTSILADKFVPARRPMVLTIFALGACLGAWLGSSVAGVVAEHSGWRAAFIVLGVPGLAAALLVLLTVREPTRGNLDHSSRASPSPLKATIDFVLAQRSAVHLIIGGSVATLWSWGLMWWTTAFLQRSHHLSVAEAGSLLGKMHLIAGTGGTLCASYLVGRRVAGDPRYVTRLLAWVVGLSTLPSIWLYWVDSLEVAIVLLWIFVPAVYFYIGPILGLLQNVVPANMRAITCAVLLFLANFGNLFIAPQLIGILSDWIRGSFAVGDESLRWALLLLAPTGFWAAWHLWRAGETIRADEGRVIGASEDRPLLNPAQIIS